MSLPFQLKSYQERTLEALDSYFRECVLTGPRHAFTRAFDHSKGYNTIPGFHKDMPYVCLRLPTGGGKTLLGGFAIGLANQRLLHVEHSVILWLVPSRAIMEQTLRALRNRKDPMRMALENGWGRWPGCGSVSVVDLAEARTLTRATLDTETVVIVATAQAFRVEEKEHREAKKLDELRKVYEESGSLMPHFDGLTAEQKSHLRHTDKGVVIRSFENVLRLRRPVLIVDEAHNARSEVSFETLARFRPSCILELTATPDTNKNPSNVLHSVSAGELKDEQMVKLPILLETQKDWQNLLASAIARRGELHELARREQMEGGDYVRPIILIQAQPKDHKHGTDTLNVDALKKELMTNHQIPEEEIAIATGEQKGLEGMDLFAESCRIKYILTQQALAEGWDCSFAYILVSLAEIQSAKSVEQLLGRILRMPYAQDRKHPALNKAYAFVASAQFHATAQNLRDALVECAGFEKKDATEFITAAKEEQMPLGISALDRRAQVRPVVVQLPEKPAIDKLSPAIKDKIVWNAGTSKLTLKVALDDEEEEAFKATLVMDDAKALVKEANKVIKTHKAEVFRTPSELGKSFFVPQIALFIQGEMQLFDDPEVLDYPWQLPIYEAAPTAEELADLGLASRVAEGGEIDVEKGKVIVNHLKELHHELELVYQPEEVSEARLAGWLCRNLIDDYTDQKSLLAFVSSWLGSLTSREDFPLAKANRLKFVLRSILGKRLQSMRIQAKETAWQSTLFDDGREARVKVGGDFVFEFQSDAYHPSRISPRTHDFKYHFYPQVGELDSADELLCAMKLDQLCAKGVLKFWVRNLVRKGAGSFFLQKANGRFYPDFIAQTHDDRILIVEFKGDGYWNDAADDRRIGELWAEMSNGKCLFTMVKKQTMAQIDALLK
jgi:type III restriction enzyme